MVKFKYSPLIYLLAMTPTAMFFQKAMISHVENENVKILHIRSCLAIQAHTYRRPFFTFLNFTCPFQVQPRLESALRRENKK